MATTIAPAAPAYEEVVDDLGNVASAGFSLRVQKANAKYLIDPEDIEDAILDILGDAEPNGFGGLKRRLPACHPRYAWLLADNISDIRQVGLFENQPSSAAYAVIGPDPMTEEYAQHTKAVLAVEFTPRPYAVIPDSTLYTSQLATTLSWTDFDDTHTTSTISQEWRRFCWVDYLPRTQIITAQQGQMVFRAGNNPTTSTTPPNGVAFGGRPQMRLTGGQVKLYWQCVPYSWVTHLNSWIVYLQGRINQTAFLDWQPGELLYESCDVTSYVPPVPDIDTSLGDGVYSSERLCDITFNMMEAIRNPGSPTTLPSPGWIGSQNWIVGGHNLMPWVKDRKFYYVTSSGADPNLGTGAPAADLANWDKWTPTFFSAPFELLFSDPAIASTYTP